MQIRMEQVLVESPGTQSIPPGTRLADLPLDRLVAAASVRLHIMPDLRRLPTVTHGNDSSDNFY